MSKLATMEDRWRAGHNESFFAKMDVVSGKLWDCLECVPGERLFGRKEIFRVPAYHSNQDGSDKTYSQTNLTQGSRLDAPESFLIQRIIFTFSRAVADEDVYAVAESAVFNFWVGCKTYARALLIALPAMATDVGAPIRICSFCETVYANAASCPNCGAGKFTLSDIGVQAQYGRQFCLDLQPLEIPNQCEFHADYEFNPGVELLNRPRGCGVKLWCHLEGLHARGVQ